MPLQKRHRSSDIQKDIFYNLIILVLISTILVGCISVIVNVRSESQYLDSNLQNMAKTIADSVPVQEDLSADSDDTSNYLLLTYLNSLKTSLSNIDVISVVDQNQIRRYHSNSSMIGTAYDGTVPTFGKDGHRIYVTSDTGPSGSQRRAYAPIYDEDGNYLGFVIAVMLNENIYHVIMNTIWVHLIGFAVVFLFALMISRMLSRRIKTKLLGYEPDIFSSMFTIRNNALDSLSEGIIAVGPDELIIYCNKAVSRILENDISLIGGKTEQLSTSFSMKNAIATGEVTTGLSVHLSHGKDVLVDKVPIMEEDQIIGALCILRDRTEYTKLMEDLSGIQYIVDSMRANNHDFINKLHVILGLIQMGKTSEACEYITHISSIQQAILQNIVKHIEDPSVAALLIGKYAQAAELNIQFSVETGSSLSRSDISLPSGDLVTIIGNLLDNAMDSINEKSNPPKEVSIGIYSQPHTLLISVDDTGMGIEEADQERIFEKGFTTKGNSHGTGMYVVKNLVDKLQGTIQIESEKGNGTYITVTISQEKEV
ncbi:MAG: sensor histidine kinase [Lachnospira sp.]|nr:sensor histidine kinase [Lachnospira sp.]